MPHLNVDAEKQNRFQYTFFFSIFFDFDFVFCVLGR